ncbi:MAG: shikimate dehydrogenase [Actinomycetota bacterium]|nr:shikimate dehydrogenase [Actinomycetota bacterium]
MLGSPIAHSLSPVLHRAAYAELGLDWAYRAVECTEPELAATLDRLGADPSYAGLSLTMPLKTAVLALLDDVEDLATKVGAVNTVLLGTRRRGLNTDVAGIAAALDELGVLRPERSVVLGAGGTARAALAALLARHAESVTVLVRDPGRVGPLRGAAEAIGLTVDVARWERAGTVLAGADVVVATTPAAAFDELVSHGPADPWPHGVPLLDVVYAPWPTRLAAAARASGAPVVGGLSVLVAQAAEQVQAMTGRTPPVAAMRAAGERALQQRA